MNKYRYVTKCGKSGFLFANTVSLANDMVRGAGYTPISMKSEGNVYIERDHLVKLLGTLYKQAKGRQRPGATRPSGKMMGFKQVIAIVNKW